MALFETIPLPGLIENGIRTDGRKIDELRPVSLEVGILPKADGSALINMGKNKILAAVFGPNEVHPRHLAKQNTGIIRCSYRMSTFAVDERKSPA
ncbi:MAG: exosome complex exonuclease Rrp41, partial [Candidatus Helarchaeales archaeon]